MKFGRFCLDDGVPDCYIFIVDALAWVLAFISMKFFFVGDPEAQTGLFFFNEEAVLGLVAAFGTLSLRGDEYLLFELIALVVPKFLCFKALVLVLSVFKVVLATLLSIYYAFLFLLVDWGVIVDPDLSCYFLLVEWTEFLGEKADDFFVVLLAIDDLLYNLILSRSLLELGDI